MSVIKECLSFGRLLGGHFKVTKLKFLKKTEKSIALKSATKFGDRATSTLLTYSSFIDAKKFDVSSVISSN